MSLAQAQIKSSIIKHASLRRFSHSVFLGRKVDFSLENNNRVLRIASREQTLELSPIALLDSCKCEHCFHSATNQRKANIFLNQNHKHSKWTQWTIDNVSCTDLKQENKLRIQCSVNSHNVIYDLPLNDHERAPRPVPFLWDKNTLHKELAHDRHLPTVHVDNLANEQGMREWIGALIKYGFCIIDGVDASRDEHTFNLIKYLGHYKNTLFGSTWSFENKLDFLDTAYTNDTIEPHTDNTYFNDPTRIFFLHCVHYNAKGGNSTITDAHRIASHMRLHHAHHFHVLCNTHILFHYEDNEHHYVHRAPIISLSPEGDIVQIRFNHHDRFHVHHLSAQQQEEFFEAYQVWCSYVHDAEHASAEFLLQPGRVLTFDNWRVLHGRTHFEGERRCVGFYTTSDDFESKARLLFGPAESENVAESTPSEIV